MRNKEIQSEQASHIQLIERANNTLQKEVKSINTKYRLNYHFMPPVHWMNDPNGLIFYKGEYHLFYQHYPYAPKWGPMHWGHAKSRNLFHWEHLPVALAPSEWYDKGELESHGCWSGSAVDDDGVLTLIYTGHVEENHPQETQCVARSKDGIHFEKYENNPVIKAAPEENCFGFRDPKVWKHEDKWYMIVGSGKDEIGKIHLYQSKDLNTWDYMGVAAESDGTMGNMWECPDLFPLQDKHVLVISPMNIKERNLYAIGDMDYDAGKFTFDHFQVLDFGSDFYASQTLLDDKNRRILIAWMEIWGSKSIEEAKDYGWLGAMTIPRELIVAENGTLLMRPVEEHKQLRNRHFSFKNITLENVTKIIDKFSEVSYELNALIEINEDVQEVGFSLRCSEDDTEKTVVTYKVVEGLLEVDKNLSGNGVQGISVAPLNHKDGRIHLQIFVDVSSIEVFANHGEKVITNRIYPSENSKQVKVFTRGGKATINMDVWTIDSVWDE